MPSSSLDAKKERLVARLAASRAVLARVLAGIDPDRVVRPGWTAKDLIGHVLMWEEGTACALEARQRDQTYDVPGFESFDQYNAQAREEMRDVPLAEMHDRLGTARARLLAALHALTAEQFAAPIAFPHTWTGTITRLLRIIANHEREHAREIEPEIEIGPESE
jgi:hypothetical protein